MKNWDYNFNQFEWNHSPNIFTCLVLRNICVEVPFQAIKATQLFFSVPLQRLINGRLQTLHFIKLPSCGCARHMLNSDLQISILHRKLDTTHSGIRLKGGKFHWLHKHAEPVISRCENDAALPGPALFLCVRKRSRGKVTRPRALFLWSQSSICADARHGITQLMEKGIKEILAVSRFFPLFFGTGQKGPAVELMLLWKWLPWQWRLHLVQEIQSFVSMFAYCP